MDMNMDTAGCRHCRHGGAVCCAALRCCCAALRCAALCCHSCVGSDGVPTLLSRSRHPAHNPDATLTVEDLAIIMADATNRDREK